MLERIDTMLSSTATTVITGAMFLAIVLHTSFDVPSWIHTSWITVMTYQAGL
ncbi:amino acid adenylation domain-containing protein [Veillonella sp. CHU110]|uniref:amino acid adenylation domain-containing protein n=1 Tax=Veillonella sp. CHU110 TaxID=2490947 RepID=UPI0013E07085|nr:amino acid adenylation domain-containing protein [Veillonella sp. CHU110]